MATARPQARRNTLDPATGTPNAALGDMEASTPGRDSPEILQALETQRLATLQGQMAELEATRSELQYDLNATLDTLAQVRTQSAVAEERHRAAGRLHEAEIAASAEQLAVAEERHRAAGRLHEAEIAASAEQLAVARTETETVSAIAVLRQQLAIAERDNEALRERLGQLSGVPPLLEKNRQQLTELSQRLALVVQDRKSLRRELQRRTRLLARARSELRAAQKSVADVRRSVRRLERDRWVLRRDAETTKALRRRDAETTKALRRRDAETNEALRRQNAELGHLVDQLGDGFRAVLASRRWRLGSALSTVPRRLLFRPGTPAAPDAMLELVEAYRRRTSRVGVGFPSKPAGEAAHVEPGDDPVKGGA